MFEVRCVVDCNNQLGECPVWCPDQQVLWWVDISKPSLARLHPASGKVDTWPLPKTIGSFALRQGGGFLLAFRTGLATMAQPGAAIEWIELPGTRPADGRFNDGKCDSRGRFWVGSMDRNLTNPIGELYRIDGGGAPAGMAAANAAAAASGPAGATCTAMDRGFTISNGLGWSPDQRTMYFTDSPPRRIYAYDFDAAAGTIANRRVFVQFDDAPGRPDGCSVDAEGFVWVARVRGWRIDRYDPDGRLERTIDLPFERPTSLVFGGPDLTTLYVTSSTLTLTPEDLSKQPQAGGVFVIETGIKGQHEHRFAG